MQLYPVAMVPAHSRIDMKNCVFKIKDGATTPNELTIKVGEGNFTWTEKIDRQYFPNRGVLDEVVNGDEQPVEVRMDFVWEYLKTNSTGATPTVKDALKQEGGAADWTSSDADTCRPYAVDLELTYTPDCSTGDIETTTFADFRVEEFSHDPRTGQISCTGKCNITAPTSVRTAQ